MQLIDLIYPHNKIVSIVGTSKNAGKTVTLNEIILQADLKGIKLGLISTGRDGERRDVLTETEKPPIYVKKGTILTTVEGAIKSELAGIEILSVTDYNTPMGRVILGRAMDDGYVEISGPHSAVSTRRICEEMAALGAQLVLIDGSLDRRASAAPYISDGTVLSTGAALARSMSMVIDKTMHIISTYSIPKVEEAGIADIAYEAFDIGKSAVVDRFGSVSYIDTLTTVKSGDVIAEYLDENTEHVILSGSATVDTVKDIMLNKKSSFSIIVKDPTRIFIPPKDFQVLQKMGMDIRVVDNINIIAITVNPYSPEGYYFDPEEFLLRMRNAVPQIPVFDVMANQ